MEGYFVHIANRLDKIRRAEDSGSDSSSFLGKCVQELKSVDLWRAVLSEFIATCLFVFIATMSAVDIVSVTDTGGKIVRIAFSFGLMIAICIQMFGHVSGGHMNPAVSIAMAVVMEITPLRAFLYAVAQCAGGICGSLMLMGVTPSRVHSNLGLASVNPDLSAGQALACEFVFTFILVMSIFGCTDPNRALLGSPAIGIGLTVGVAHLAGIPFTGISMNPARSVAASVVSSASVRFDNHWVFWVGPICGGIVAALAYKTIFSPYRSNMTLSEAGEKLKGSSDMIVIPKTYFLNNINHCGEHQLTHL